MLRIKNIKIGVDSNENQLIVKASKQLGVKPSAIKNLSISKKALDSRRKNNLVYVYSVDVEIENEFLYTNIQNVDQVEKYEYKIKQINNSKNRPVVVGTGPAGLFTGLILAQSGLNPIMIEMGKDVDARQADIELFWKTGELNVNSNVQFGAGGAGTFSDGKLTTSVNDSRREKLLSELIRFGAPEEIMYLSKAHVGTDILRDVVRNMCNEIENLGGTILFNTKFIDFELENAKIASITVESNEETKQIACDDLVLAIGHSSRDTFELLYAKKMEMKAKPFSMGVRVEHKQKDVNVCQLGEKYQNLDSASYKLSTHLDNGRGVYTFCMCPGGVVVASSSEIGRVVTNGMSYYARDLENANSAVLVSITPADFNGDENPLNGIEFQRKLEQLAFEMGGSNYYAPVQTVKDYLNNVKTTKLGNITPTYQPGVTYSNLNELFPAFINESLHEALINMGNKMSVFKQEDAVLTAIESRSSSPVSIMRDEQLMANYKGIYPCGEGAGYAGGIVSAAIDGIKVAEQVIANIERNNQ